MRVKTAKRGKRTAGRVHYCPRCANDLVAGGEIDIFPLAGTYHYLYYLYYFICILNNINMVFVIFSIFSFFS